MTGGLPWRHLPGYHCFGCCADNRSGIALVPEIEDGALAARFTLDRRHESYPGLVHGGVAIAVVDELMGNALALLERKACVTVSLRTRFVAPLRVGRPYRAVATIVARPERPDGVFTVAGDIFDQDGELAVTASASYCWLTDVQAAALMVPDPSLVPELSDYFRRQEPRP